MKTSLAFVLSAVSAGLIGFVGLEVASHPGRSRAALGQTTAHVSRPVEKPPTTRSETQEFIHRRSKDPDPEVQDRVGRARIRLAYLDAQRKDFKAARATLLTAVREYKGTGKMGADFGGIPDQAAYQAAVCLAAEGRRREARQEFLRFLRERRLSPLAQAVYRRLERLNGGRPDEEGQRLLQEATAERESHIRFETSVCGPKALAYLLPLLGKPTHDYRDLAKLCGTTDRGTSLEGMRQGLNALGVTSYGLEVNRRDLAALRLPFVLLRDDHYLVATELRERTLYVYDPRFGSESRIALPALDDLKFTAIVLVTELPDLNRDRP